MILIIQYHYTPNLPRCQLLAPRGYLLYSDRKYLLAPGGYLLSHDQPYLLPHEACPPITMVKSVALKTHAPDLAVSILDLAVGILGRLVEI